MVGAVVGILVTLIIAVLVFYNIAGSIDTTTIDGSLTGTPAANATDDTLSQAATFFSVAPIIAIVIVAVVIFVIVAVAAADVIAGGPSTSLFCSIAIFYQWLQ